ncbi:MAG: sialate O-acetylesterase [Alphaproteobacteria bacterium]|nr:sialate O-acetylesterase [Alphaproteobacteria bacterium]
MPTAIDVFLIAGQSNAVGEGDSAQSPQVIPDKILQIYNGVITPANDPVGNAMTGSAWPAFGNEYYALSNRSIAFIPTAVGGTGMSPYADIGTGHWSGYTVPSSHDLLGRSIEKTNAAMALLLANGYSPSFKGILWCQGENEANNICFGAQLSKEDVEAMLAGVIQRYRKHLEGDWVFYIFKTGTDTRVDQNCQPIIPNDSGYRIVHAAQESVARNVPGTKIIFSGAADFGPRGMMKDGIHYNQDGYNEMGKTGAQTLLSA